MQYSVTINQNIPVSDNILYIFIYKNQCRKTHLPYYLYMHDETEKDMYL